jgi:hypothetical protein
MHGMGRFITISEAALVFYKSGPIITNPSPQEQRKMQAMLLLEYVTPSPGFPALRDTFWTKMRVKRDTLAQPIYAGPEYHRLTSHCLRLRIRISSTS